MKEKGVRIISGKTDITSIYPEELDLVKNIIPTGCPLDNVVVVFKYLHFSNPVSFTALCSSVVKGSEVCEYCALNPNQHPTRLDFVL